MDCTGSGDWLKKTFRRCPTSYQCRPHGDLAQYPEIALKGLPPYHKRLDRNTNVSYMGWERRKFIYPNGLPTSCGTPERSDRGKLNVPHYYLKNPSQVASWAITVGMPEYAPVFCKHRIDGRKLVTLDAVALDCLGVKNTAKNQQMEKLIRDLVQQARRQATEYDVLPYLFTQHLNLGLEPPRPNHRELCQSQRPLTQSDQPVHQCQR